MSAPIRLRGCDDAARRGPHVWADVAMHAADGTEYVANISAPTPADLVAVAEGHAADLGLDLAATDWLDGSASALGVIADAGAPLSDPSAPRRFA